MKSNSKREKIKINTEPFQGKEKAEKKNESLSLPSITKLLIYYDNK